LTLWVVLISACVGFAAMYYVLSQTILSPTAVKHWLDQSGSYSILAEEVVPLLAQGEEAPKSTLLTHDMLKRAAKASLKPEDVKAKTEPMVDAVYAWLDSKSPEITFTVSTEDETRKFLHALRTELLAKVKTLPGCTQYVDVAELEQANCLPWYITADTAVSTVMTRVEQQDVFRDKQLTPESFTGRVATTPSKRIPDIISLMWVVQLVAIPLAAISALFLIVKRRAIGLFAVGLSLLIPGLLLLASGVFFSVAGSTTITAFVEKSELAAIAVPFGSTVASSLALICYQVGGVLGIIAIALGVVSIWWRKRTPQTEQKASSTRALDE
jgi:hypothetical protein